MTTMQDIASESTDTEVLVTPGLETLSWCIDEIRRSFADAMSHLQGAVETGSDSATAAHAARAAAHQAGGALTIIDIPGPGLLVSEIEGLLDDVARGDVTLGAGVVNRVGRGFDAVVGYLDELLHDGLQQPLYLFPYYKAVLEARGADRIEAAELFIAPPAPDLEASGELELDASQRKKLLSHFELGLLKLLTGDAAQEGAGRLLAAARTMRKTTIGARDPGFWLVVVGLLEALASGKLETDVSIKRLLARLNLQLRKTLGDDAPISARLLRDSLFAISRIRRRTPTVVEVVEAWRLDDAVPTDYRVPRYGRVDRRALATIDESIRRTKQAWEALAAGERPEGLGAGLATLRETLESLGIDGVDELAAAWVEVGKRSSHGEKVEDELALEVAGSLLFAEEVFRDGVDRDPTVGPRSAELAKRLRAWLADGRVDEPMPQWLRELTNRAHERATMASFVAATRTRLGDVELTLDGYFRDRSRREGLPEATSGLREVGGVLSLVGQEEAARAAQIIADQVESLEGEADAASDDHCERIAESVGALGFLVEGLLRGGQDPVEYRLDEAAGTFTMHPLEPDQPSDAPAAGMHGTPRESAEARFDTIREAIATRLRGALDRGERIARDAAIDDSLAQWRDAAQLAGDAVLARRADDAFAAFADGGSVEPARLAAILDLPGDWRSVEAAVAQAVAGTADEDVDAELLEIFLAEAGEVLEAMRDALATIRREPSNDNALTTIRRGYHTLKGSSRMVGLAAFGDLAWSFEQLLNFWLGENRPASDTLAELIDVSSERFTTWVGHLEASPSAVFDCTRLIAAADALRESKPLPERPWIEDEAVEAVEEVAEVEAIEVVDTFEEADAVEAIDAIEEALVIVASAPVEEAPTVDLPDDSSETAEPFEFPEAFPAALDESGYEQIILEAPVEEPPGDSPGLVEEPTEEPFELRLDQVSADIAEAMPEAAGELGFPGLLEQSHEAGFEELVEPSFGADIEEPVEPSVEADIEELVESLPEADIEEFIEASAPPASTDPEALPEEPVAEDDIPVLTEMDTIVPESSHEAGEDDSPPLLTEPLDVSPEVAVAPLEEVEIDGRRISASLYRIFLGEADETMATLDADLADWRGTPARAASEPAQRAMHSLKGSAAVVGADEVHRLAQELERFLLRQRAMGVPLPEPELDEYAALLDRLAAMLHQFAAGRMPEPEPETQARAHALADNWSSRQIAATPPPEPVVGAEMHEASGNGAIVDELDAELLPIFIEEAIDQLPEIDARLREWLQHPADRALAQNLMRLLHTVKGSARMAGAMRLGQRVHEMETRIEAAAELGTVPLSLIEELVVEHDIVIEMFEAIRDPGSVPAPADSTPPAVTSAPAGTVVDEPASSESPPSTAASEPDSAATPSTPPPAGIAAPSPATIAAALAEHATGPGLVRVRADLLERLVNESGEVSIARSRLDNSLDAIRQSLWDLTENVTRLRTQLREIEIQAETQIQSRIAAARESHEEFDPLEFDRYTRTQELTRMLAESVNDVATVQHNATRSLDDAGQNLLRQGQVLRELQQNLMRIRMVRFGTLGDRLYRVVRQAAKELGKRVSLDIRGSDVEIDRSVLERMAAPVEHLLRNAVAHGIESPGQRAAAGKAEIGEIRLAVRQEGNEVLLELRDDGSGLDLGRIRARAVEAGMLGADETIGEQGLAEMIFRPGFSTADAVSEISGRGVGMDVVRAEVGALGGRVEVVSESGQGARFIVHLPLTLAIAQVVLVGVGDLRFALPSSSVEQVIQLRPRALAKAYAERRIDWQGEPVPLYYLGALVEAGDQPIAQHYSPVVVMRASGRRIAVHVDSVTRNQEVVVKNVGPQVARVRGVGGATILGNGEIVLILDLGPLAAAVGEPVSGGPLQVRPQRLADAPPTVMVVDDSLTVRKATQRLLQRECYDVMLAKDGVDALRQLQERVPDAMLVDIEMPRMDGFDLTRHVRSDARYRHVPIVMISSRTADKHRNYAASLGVDAFLGKPYPEAELLELLRGYLARVRASGAN
ncbi:MAG: Hpt domain-containing protein [Burkholderiaceae bacterium]